MIGISRITGVISAVSEIAGAPSSLASGRAMLRAWGRAGAGMGSFAGGVVAAFAVVTTLALVTTPGPAIAAPAAAAPAIAAENGPKGTVTGLPLPRYVSLKSDRVNLRQGPNKDHATTWVYHRVGLPMEITAEFETWRRIRDSEGVEGWVLHSLLSGKRTALVAPWEKADYVPMYRESAETSRLAARLEPNVVVQVEGCDKIWCQVEVSKRKGFIRQEKLWGVYPGEIF